MELKSVMWRYIAEARNRMRELLASPDIPAAAAWISGFQSVYFVAHGSSYNAAVTVRDWFSRVTGMRAYCCKPNEFAQSCRSPYLEQAGTALGVFISQTGTSRGVIKALEEAVNHGIPALTVTGAPNSPLRLMGGFGLDLGCGREDSNAKTKGYSCTLLLLLLLAAETGLRRGAVSAERRGAIRAALAENVDALERVAGQTLAWCEARSYGLRMEELFVVGSGMNYGTAMECALKLTETQCIPACFEELQEFSHGMHRAVGRRSSVILLCGRREPLAERTLEFLSGVAGSCVLLDAAGGMAGEHVLTLEPYSDAESILSLTTAIQVLSAFVPEINGRDPNADINSAYVALAETRV